MYPRSSIGNTPLRLSNSVGIIDRDYIGNIIAKVDNMSDQEYIIKKDSGYFRYVIQNVHLKYNNDE
jgi:dUTP pyrophosphatase